MRRILFLLLAMVGVLTAPAIERPQALMLGKLLVITTTAGTTYHYTVTALDNPMIQRLKDSIIVENDTFQLSQVKALRFCTMKHYLLDEDSTAFGADYAVDHGLLAFRRTLHNGQWNSLTVPFNLTGLQVRQLFGNDARLAVVKGMRGGEEAAVEFATVDLDNTKDIAVKAGSHYLLWPTREPDLAASEKLGINWKGTRAAGPIYLLPCVSMESGQKKSTPQNIYNTDRTQHVFISGSYARLDDSYKVGSIVKNPRLAPGMYVFNEEGRVEQHSDSTAIQAFRSWFKEMCNPSQPLHFYIDGIDEDLIVADGIALLPADGQSCEEAVYDLSGRRVGTAAQLSTLPKGIYVVRSANGRGKKYLNR